MNCTPEVVRDREATGDLFAVLALGRVSGPRYPAFQLNERLDKSLFKQIIREYRDAGASTTCYGASYGRRKKIFAGLTPMEMMPGGSAPAYDALTPDE